jgi:hypothetical protein
LFIVTTLRRSTFIVTHDGTRSLQLWQPYLLTSSSALHCPPLHDWRGDIRLRRDNSGAIWRSEPPSLLLMKPLIVEAVFYRRDQDHVDFQEITVDMAEAVELDGTVNKKLNAIVF